MASFRFDARVRAAFVSVFSFVVLGSPAAFAGSQVNQGLLCHKVADSVKFKGTMTVAAAKELFDVPPGCVLKGKAAEFCTAATIHGFSSSLPAGTTINPATDLSAHDYLCYRMKCGGAEPAPGEVADGFAVRELEFKAAGKICIPAEGPGGATPTSTTSTLPPTTTTAEPTTTTAEPTTTTTMQMCVAETCNNADDDCDTFVDEGLSQSCYSGPAGTAGVGPCKTGTQSCSAGSWGTCFNEVTPAGEFCDNADNDCDGVIDDNLTRTCYTGASGTVGVGACKAGTQTCSAGSWGAGCPGQVTPTSESCADSIDNDCDGSVNEGC